MDAAPAPSPEPAGPISDRAAFAAALAAKLGGAPAPRLAPSRKASVVAPTAEGTEEPAPAAADTAASDAAISSPAGESKKGNKKKKEKNHSR